MSAWDIAMNDLRRRRDEMTALITLLETVRPYTEREWCIIDLSRAPFMAAALLALASSAPGRER